MNKWDDALATCQNSISDATANLASIPDQGTNEFLAALTTATVWTGARYALINGWTWSDGSLWTGYTNWEDNEPNAIAVSGDQQDQPFIFFNWNTGSGRWNDHHEDDPNLRPALCQYDLPSRVNFPSHTIPNSFSSGSDDTHLQDPFLDWCRKDSCDFDGEIRLRQRVFQSRNRNKLIEDYSCADLRLNMDSNLNYTYINCKEKIMPLCMKGSPKIVKNSRTLDITRFLKNKKNKKHKKMKLNQERERIKERRKKIKKRRRGRQLTRQESDPPVEMCATAGTTLIVCESVS